MNSQNTECFHMLQLFIYFSKNLIFALYLFIGRKLYLTYIEALPHPRFALERMLRDTP